MNGANSTHPGFQDTWRTLSEQFATLQLDATQSVRGSEEQPTANLDVDALPLLTLASSGETSELTTRRVLGEGGMGKVQLATQRSLGRDVAIKSLRDHAGGKGAQALLQEALFTGFLEHPNIVPVHQLGRGSDDLPLLVMKRVEGVSWEALIEDADLPQWRALGEDPVQAHLSILLSVCNAVAFAHSHRILHRDIKPANVMVGAFGEVYLLDWGLAMRLDPPRPVSGAIVGTPCQMAPEMLSGTSRVDERTDVYLLGGCLHMALTGTVRHSGESLRDVFHAVFASEPVTYPDHVPEELADLCNRAMHVDVEQRPQSAAAFREAIEQYLEHRASIALTTEAKVGLASLGAALEGSEPDQERIAGLFAECRFGFAQALRAWPENTVALDGLQAALTLVIERELGRGNLGLAEALVAELPRPAPTLATRVAALRDEVNQREARLRSLESRGDWRQGAGARVAFFLGMVAIVATLWLWANEGHIRYQGTLSPERLATNVGVAITLLSALVYAMRTQLLTTEANTRLVLGALLCGWAIFVNRLANCIPATPTAALVSTEILFCAFGASLGGLTLVPWLWLQVPIWLAGGFAARLFPSFAGLSFAVSALLSLAVGIWKLRVQDTPEARPRSA